MPFNYPESSEVFRDDDGGFFRWLDHHPGGFFINADRNPKPGYLVLHRPGCPHFDRAPGVHWTRDYIKVCSADQGDLTEWAAAEVGGNPTLCTRCFG